MKHLPLLALILATQTGCSILSGNTVAMPIASNNGNNNGSGNGSSNGSYNSAGATLPEQVPIGVTRLAQADPAFPTTGAGTPVVLPQNVSLNRVSTQIAEMNLPRTENGSVDLQSMYYGGEVNPAINMPTSNPPTQAKPATAAAPAEATQYVGASGSR